MSTTSSGRLAENLAANYLKDIGYKILAVNWRNRWCEIDIVAAKANVIYFVEVKYRTKNNWGDGLAAITAKKLHQMTFAAEMWVQDNDWPGDYRLMAIALAGEEFNITDCIEI